MSDTMESLIAESKKHGDVSTALYTTKLYNELVAACDDWVTSDDLSVTRFWAVDWDADPSGDTYHWRIELHRKAAVNPFVAFINECADDCVRGDA